MCNFLKKLFRFNLNGIKMFNPLESKGQEIIMGIKHGDQKYL